MLIEIYRLKMGELLIVKSIGTQINLSTYLHKKHLYLQ
jgi:hypothetical protein